VRDTKRGENSNTGILESDSQAGSLSYYGYFSEDIACTIRHTKKHENLRSLSF
jgi:hypothetical protein